MKRRFARSYKLTVFSGLLALLVSSCEAPKESEDQWLTGNEITYTLYQASDYPVYGVAVFKEGKDGSTWVELKLTGTEGNVYHPVHLHYGEIEEDGNIALLLQPVLGSTGRSVTHIDRLADGTQVTYNDLLNLEASVKIHLSDSGEDYFTILAGGNIGDAAEKSKNTIAGRLYISVCK